MLKILVLFGLLGISSNTFAAYYLDTDKYRECTNTESSGICGALSNASDENGFMCYISLDGADDVCVCNLSDMTFYYGAGCFCENGWYSDPYDGTWAGCDKCPADYPLSDGYNGNSVGNVNSMEDACYRQYSKTEQNITLTLEISMIDEEGGYEPYIIDAICDSGYWTENTYSGYYYEGDDYTCNPVGIYYYSVPNNSREMCPAYVAQSGENLTGQTTGSGTGADSLTDCKIPSTEIFSDNTGTWHYDDGCYYSE
ncbi:MAG: hypothetical protein IJX89_03030 [Alphaproteobacteria bacterium]|nr:hypothetical protein [Alphaproteobacteria bacterium]